MMNRFLSLSYVLIFFIRWTQSMSPLPLHLQMSAAERQYVFGTSDEKEVPVYELVRIAHSIHGSGSSKCVRFFVFDENVELKLQQTDRLLFSETIPIWLATVTTSQVTYRHVAMDTFHDALKFYEDPNNMAGISLRNDSQGNLEFTGYIRNRLVLRMIPQRVHDVWTKLFNTTTKHRVIRSTKTSDFSDYHIIINRSLSDNASFQSKINNIKLQKRGSAHHYQGPKTIYFRTLVFVDFNEYYVSNQDVRFYELLIYLTCFWNAVNMRLHEFESPSIRLHIAGIVIRKNVSQREYFMWMNRSSIKATETLEEFRDFLYMNDPIGQQWDIAVSQSDIPIQISEAEKLILGIAFVGTTCASSQYVFVPSLALIRDQHDFSGIEVAVHEIGHLLGAIHDGPGEFMCNLKGYVMTPELSTIGLHSQSWSWCSRMEILERLRLHASNCWNGTVSVRKDEMVPEILPGHITGIDDQCVLRGYHSACKETGTTCDKLVCQFQDELSLKFWEDLGISIMKCRNAGVPLAGTRCGEGMHCKHQVCVPQTTCGEE